MKITVFENLIGVGDRPNITTRDEETGGGVDPTLFSNKLLLEDGTPLLLEGGGFLLLE